MTTLLLAYNRIQKKVQIGIDSIEVPSVNWKTICLICFTSCFFLLIFYVWQINSLTKGAYMVNSYQNQILQLSKENKNLEITFAQSSFLGQAVEKVRAMNFQKAVTVKYIQVPDVALARAGN
jgi:hypothetical protein